MGRGTKNACAGEDQQQFFRLDQSLKTRRSLRKSKNSVMGPNGTRNQDLLWWRGLAQSVRKLTVRHTAITLVSAYCRKQEGRENGRLANSPPEGDEPCLTDGPA
jgi:hypothetical protein